MDQNSYETKPKKKVTILKVNLAVFAVSVILAFFYLGSREILSWYGYDYRTWVVVIGEIITFAAVPVSLLCLPAAACVQRNRKEQTEGTRAAAVAVGIMMGILILLYLLVGTFLYALTRGERIEKETWFRDGILEGVHTEYAGLESYTICRYYEPCTVFLKKSYEPLSDIVEMKAEEKYGEAFRVQTQENGSADSATDQNGNQSGRNEEPVVYTLYQVSQPEIVMHMYAGNALYGFSDDYPQARTNWLLLQNDAFCEIAEFPESSDGDTDIFVKPPVVTVEGPEYGEEAAGIIVQAVEEVRADTIFASNGMSGVEIELKLCREGEVCRTMTFRPGSGTDAAELADEIAQNYEEYTAGTDGSMQDENTAGTDGAAGNMQDENVAGTDGVAGNMQDENAAGTDGSMQDENTAGTDGATGSRGDGGSMTEKQPKEQEGEASPETVEGAYRCLYEQIFEPQGDAYDCRYNAKGNFYAFLSEGTGSPGDGMPEMRSERTVVYDRESENGKCHLFVYYETFYDEDGTEYSTAIRDTYAVNKETGEVTASGKHAWADVGTEEYQQETGEK